MREVWRGLARDVGRNCACRDETFLNTGYKKFVLDGEDGRIYCRELIWGRRLVRGRNCVAGEGLDFGIRNSG